MILSVWFQFRMVNIIVDHKDKTETRNAKEPHTEGRGIILHTSVDTSDVSADMSC